MDDIYILLWDFIKKKSKTKVIKHGDDVIGLNVVYADKGKYISCECQWCKDLDDRILSRTGFKYHTRIWTNEFRG